ncbi:MAG: hypothetical protein HYZ28_01000 [Myxococcales bacterium]|nr:hypothetical protein [Myxococcales bacterium]
MARSVVLLAVLAPAWASAGAPDFSKGGLVFGLQYGPGSWLLDRARLTDQVGQPNADLFVGEAQGTHTASIRLGYNILGHATVEAALTGTGWNVFNASRGGAGFLVGIVRWHPMELVWRDQVRPVPIDASALFGVGYGIAGQDRGMDGAVLEVGVDADYWFSKAVGAGLFARGVLLQWSSFYLDYDNRAQPGATINLTRGSGGSFWTFGVALSFRFET